MGLAMAATWLSKTTNLPLLAVLGAAVLFKAGEDVRRGKSASSFLSLIGFLPGAVLPIIPWMIWCHSSFGDLTGSKLKMEHFGWTVKPFSEWWHHPIFTPAGIWTYLSGQLATFWQGEFFWRNQPLALPGSVAVYTILSLLLPGVAAFTLVSAASAQRRALLISLLCFLAGLGFFGLLSIVYDFHGCPNPSRDFPYFHAGRMILGALIPFLLLFVFGLNRLLKRFKTKTKFLVLGAMVLLMLTVEVTTDWPVFSNPFNWFHLS
jgi:hypothetical protein